MTASNYLIFYSNTNTQCFNTSTGTNVIAASDTVYILSDLQEGTKYSITVTAILDDRITEESLSATTMAVG